MKLFTYTIESCISAASINGCAKRLETLLNNLLINEKYGAGLDGSFMFVIRILDDRQKGTTYYKPVAKYQVKKKFLVISEELPWQEVIKDNEELNYKLVCEALLNAVRKITELKVREFDQPRFYRDVEQLFLDKGWISQLA